MSSEKKDTCSVGVFRSGSSHFYRCGRPAKGFLENGQPACGLHLAGEKKRKDNSARWKREIEERDNFIAEVNSFAEVFELKTLRHAGRDNERIVQMNFDELVEVLEKCHCTRSKT